jgi:hypothetical protein
VLRGPRAKQIMPSTPVKTAARMAHEQAVTAPHTLHPADTEGFVQRKMEWLPDWRDATAYPQGDISNEQWAWELLRRNRYFQKDCLEATTRTVRETVCLEWRLQSFKPFWESYADKSPVEKTGLVRPLANSGANLLVTKTTIRSPTEMVLHLNPQALNVSTAERRQQFKVLRDFIEAAYVPSGAPARSRPRSAWTSKIGKYLRVVDALSLNPSVDRKLIGEQLHHEGLVLVRYEKVRTNEEIIAQLKLWNRGSQQEEQQTLRDNLRARMAKKYSREVGSQIGRAYNLIYCDGYRFLLSSDSIAPNKRSYKRKRLPFGGGWNLSIFDETPGTPRPPAIKGMRDHKITYEPW